MQYLANVSISTVSYLLKHVQNTQCVFPSVGQFKQESSKQTLSLTFVSEFVYCFCKYVIFVKLGSTVSGSNQAINLTFRDIYNVM